MLRADVAAPEYFDYFAFLCSFFGILPTQRHASSSRGTGDGTTCRGGGDADADGGAGAPGL
jgi:hypothetical protein